MNKKEAREIIQNFSKHTSYFDNCEGHDDWNITQSEMRDMLRYRMGFGQAETECIIAAIVLAGGLKRA